MDTMTPKESWYILILAIAILLVLVFLVGPNAATMWRNIIVSMGL